MQSSIDWIKKYKFLLLYLIYFATTLICTFLHELHHDEAEHWLVVRDVDFFNIHKQCAYEGHPILWYYINWVVKHLGLGVLGFKLTNWLIIQFALLLFFLKAPFHWTVKVLFCLTHAIAYEFGIVTRDYCLALLFVFLLASFFSTKNVLFYAFIVAFGLHSNVMIFASCILFFLAYLFENREQNLKNMGLTLASTLIVILSSLILILYLKKPIDAGISSEELINFKIFDFSIFKNLYEFNSNLFQIVSFVHIAPLIALLLVLIIFFLFKIKPIPFIVFSGSFVYFFFVHSFIWNLSYYHFNLLFVVLLSCIWVGLSSPNKLQLYQSILLSVLFLPSVIYNLRFFENEFKGATYSNGKEAAEIILKRELNQKYIIVGYSPYHILSIIAYLPNTPHFAIYSKSFITYISITKSFFEYMTKLRSRNNFSPSLVEESLTNIDFSKPLLLVVPKNIVLKDSLVEKYMLIDSTESFVFGNKTEDFYFIVKKN